MATRDDFTPKRNWASVREANADGNGGGRLSIRIHETDPDGRIKPLRAVPYAFPDDPRLVRNNGQSSVSTDLTSGANVFPPFEQIVFDDVQLTAYSTQDTERLQLIQNHADDGKPWLFGREVRTYSLACSLFISNSDRAAGEFWNPRGISHWRTIYESCRLSTLARRHRLVNLVFDTLSLWGGFAQSDARLDASSPYHLQVTFGFLVVHRDTIPIAVDPIFPVVTNTAQPLYLSRESTAHLSDEDLAAITGSNTPPTPPRQPVGLVVATTKAVAPTRYSSTVSR